MYRKPAAGWTTTDHENGKLIAGDGEAYDRFGHSIGISDGTVVVGADTDDVGANNDQGSAYVFPFSGLCPAVPFLILN